MNHSEHIYFTRSKMNSLQSTYNKEDPELGITKPVKVYSLKSQTKSHKNTTLTKKNKNVATSTTSTINQTDHIDIIKRTPFSLENLFTKINSASKECITEEDAMSMNIKIKKNKTNRYKKKDDRIFYNSLSEEDKTLYNS